MSSSSSNAPSQMGEMTGGVALDVNSPVDVAVPKGTDKKEIVGRSPGQLAWLRLKRDRTAFLSAVTLVVMTVIAVAAPLIKAVRGMDPTDPFTSKLNEF